MAVLNKKTVGTPYGAVYIGRGSIWGNTFTHLPNIPNTTQVKDRNAACDAHRKLLQEQIESGQVTLQQLASLYGKDLVCFCAPLRCHGDTLVQAAAWATEKLANK